MRLIDADKLQAMHEAKCAGECSICIYNKKGKCDLIDDAPTICEIYKGIPLFAENIVARDFIAKEKRPTGEFELIKRAVLIFCRNVRPDGDMSYFDWEDRCKLQDIYHELIKETDDERSEE